MKPEIERARHDLETAKKELERVKNEVERAVRNCHHRWDNVNGVYKPIHHPGYTIPGDPPGTMGVDWRGPCYVESRTEEKWIRTCLDCGHTEESSRPRERVVRDGGIFGNESNSFDRYR